MNSLNIGILAHIDAGKTSLTERLLFNAGVIKTLGSVDKGNTQTDSLALERKRGITIKSAVTSFNSGDLKVNLIDTPGHPDFIAEVERVLTILDGVILVVSAVEGVQPQTRILMRALRRLDIPVTIFINKIDRVGARYRSLLDDIAIKLEVEVTAMGTVSNIGQPNADFKLTEKMSKNGGIPIFFGSAITGTGVDILMDNLSKLLPSSKSDSEANVSGTIFKIERGPRREKIAYLRIYSGTINSRDKLAFGKVTALKIFEQGQARSAVKLSAGEIGKVWGLENARIGDTIGGVNKRPFSFAPPTLEAAITAKDNNQQSALHIALKQLAEQDPLINLRQDEQKLYVSLYGEVQKEVISAMLIADYGVEVIFKQTRPICIERPKDIGYAVQFLQQESNPTSATLGLRIEPGEYGSGIVFQLDVSPRSVPIYIYKNKDVFVEHMRQYIHDTLRQGLRGLNVTDCIVTMTECNYYVGDGPAKPISDTPKTTAADFRKLTPMILRAALENTGTIICEPICRFDLEVPSGSLSKVLSILAKLGVIPYVTVMRSGRYMLKGDIPSARVHDLQQQLPGATSGEGFLEYTFDRYESVR